MTAALVSVPTVKENSYAKWFLLVIALLLVLLAIQMVMAVRRDRRLARDQDDAHQADVRALAEYEESSHRGVDVLGDVDDLEVHDHTIRAPGTDPEPPTPKKGTARD